jgi:hypothetical protein
VPLSNTSKGRQSRQHPQPISLIARLYPTSQIQLHKPIAFIHSSFHSIPFPCDPPTGGTHSTPFAQSSFIRTTGLFYPHSEKIALPFDEKIIYPTFDHTKQRMKIAQNHLSKKTVSAKAKYCQHLPPIFGDYVYKS